MPWPEAQSWELILLLLFFPFPPVYPFPPPPPQFFSSPPRLFLCLFVYVIFHWGVPATAYYTPLTLIGGRGCADWALIAAFPFAFVPSSLPSPDTHHKYTHSLQTQPGVHALSPFLSTSNTPQEWALTQLRGFWRQRTRDYGSISEQFHYLTLTMAESAAFPSHHPNPLCFLWPFWGHMVLYLISL